MGLSGRQTSRANDSEVQSGGILLACPAKQIAQAREDGTNADGLVFIHGYNNSFEQAAIRAAQIGCDLGVTGATALFSWPSAGKLAGYPKDEATIEASESFIRDFLVQFAEKSGATAVHIIAHSMGNRGLLRALQRIASDANAGHIKFGQIFLAAPDIDRELFLSLADVYKHPRAQRTTLYASAADKAVGASKMLHDSPRAGYFLPYTIAEGIDTIAVPDFDIDMLGHGYFAQAEALLYDIRCLMRSNEHPSTRQRLKGRVDGTKTYWEIRL